MQDESFDVVVVGGGLGGSTASSMLARAGLDVLVLERETAFRDRVRGEWLAPWGILEVDALGLRHVVDSVPFVNLITRNVGYDESISTELAEETALDIAMWIPGGGCLAVGHPQLQEAMLANAGVEGATVRRGVSGVSVEPGRAPSVTYEIDGEAHTATCRLVIAADGRESSIRKSLGIELESTTAQVILAGMLVDDTHDWPSDQQSIGVEGDFNFLIFPQADGRVRVYGAWDASDNHRFSGPGREDRFLESFRLASLPVPGAIADGTPAGPLAGYPMTDTWTDDVAADGVVLIGDAAGWSDPIIGQGMAVTFRDVHMVTDLLIADSDWSAQALAPYGIERGERMRRLRYASAGSYLLNGFGPEAAERRRRLRAMFAVDPTASPVASALLGAWVMPEEHYSDEAWGALLARYSPDLVYSAGVGTATFDFDGQVVLVTGGTKGIGRGIASRFEAAGAMVVVCARSLGDEPLPESWGFVAADLRDGEKSWAMVDETVSHWGRLDVVINNAGGSPPADTTTAPPRFSERIVALNLLAPIYVSQRANHHMQAQSTGGSIINVGTVASLRPAPTVAAYGAAKAGLANFTTTAAQEWAPKVRVNTVTAGLVRTEQASMHYGDAESIARVEQTIPAGRLATPDDVADACLYLASSAAAYVTGANLVLHGGGDRPAFLDALRDMI